MQYSCCDCVLYINNQTNTCVTVNRIRAALKETVCYIPAATVCFILIIKHKITLCSRLKDFCSFNKKQSKFDSFRLFYFTLGYYSSLVGC